MTTTTTTARRTHRSRRLAAVAGAVLSLPLAALLPAGAASAAPVHQVVDADNDPYSGLYLRNGTSMANVSRTAGNYVLYNTSAELLCGAWGEAVGPRANRRWHQVRVLGGANAGRVGWVADRYLNTPNAANQATPGEPECGATSAPAPAPAPAPAAAPASSQRASGAVAWANARMGSTGFNRRCSSFVRQAWQSQGVDLRRQYRGTWGNNTYPADVWGRTSAGRTGGPTTTPPVGALLFYSGYRGDRTTSHVSIYAGGNRVISTDDSLGSRVHVEPLTGPRSHPRLLGWWLPAS